MDKYNRPTIEYNEAQVIYGSVSAFLLNVNSFLNEAEANERTNPCTS